MWGFLLVHKSSRLAEGYLRGQSDWWTPSHWRQFSRENTLTMNVVKCQMSQMVQDAFWKALLSNRFYNTQITRSPPAPGLSSVPISSLPISNRAARMSLMRFDIKVSSLSHISFKAGVVRTLWFNALLQLSSHDSLVEFRLVDDGGTVLRRAGVGLAFPNGGSKSIHIHRHQERHGRAASLI